MEAKTHYFKALKTCSGCNKTFKSKDGVLCVRCNCADYCSKLCCQSDRKNHELDCEHHIFIQSTENFHTSYKELNQVKPNHLVYKFSIEKPNPQPSHKAKNDKGGPKPTGKQSAQKKSDVQSKLQKEGTAVTALGNPVAFHELDDRFVIKECCYCRKTDMKLLMCSRCQYAKYCTKDCQAKHFPTHKSQCKQIGMFNRARMMLLTDPLAAKRLVTYGLTQATLTPQLKDMQTLEEYQRKDRAVQGFYLKIVGRYEHMWHLAIIVEDFNGKRTHVIFHVDEKLKGHITGYPTTGSSPKTFIPLCDCLEPNNFLVLMDSHWHQFLDNTRGIRIDDLDTVHFIHMG
ncbi:unnamed protein product [Lymnaea stagnalis]|uniref:MYND-type domain-containing protein n=1 Tax=Lymnaea stagnalis TaxID=6523 RepID=A0AAV2H371_LYMST